MTKEEIEQYIDLDNKIKNRIAQISHALNGISGIIISKFVPDFRYWSFGEYDKEDFIENSQQDEKLHLGCYVDDGDDDSWVGDFDKSLLMLTDEQINEIVEYDRKKKEEEYKRQEEAEKARKEKLKEEVEQKEYEQYLRLKKKFEKEADE